MKRSLAWAAFAIAGLAACGGDDTEGQGGGGGTGGDGGGVPVVPCGEHPLDCPEGQTCWFGASDFVCLPSGSGLEGETCAPTVGQPTCAAGLLCVRSGGADGACTRLCDPSAPDTCGEQLCVLVQTESGAQTHICN